MLLFHFDTLKARIFAGLAVTGVVGVIGCCALWSLFGEVASTPTVYAPVIDAAAAPQRTAPRPALSAFPPPPAAAHVDEVPSLMADLEAVWPSIAELPAGSAETSAAMAALSRLLAEGGAPLSLTRTLRQSGRFEGLRLAYMITMRTGSLPGDVESFARAHLEAIGGRRHAGLWDEESPNRDVTALASFLEPSDVAFLRELVSSKSVHGWTNFAANREMPPPWIGWLALPNAAYARLEAMSGLTEAEHARWCSYLGQAKMTRIHADTGDPSRSCGCPGGEAISWERDGDEYPFTIPGACLRCGERQTVYIDDGRHTYGVNGIGVARYGDQTAIWARDPNAPDQGVGIGPMIGRGLRLCDDG